MNKSKKLLLVALATISTGPILASVGVIENITSVDAISVENTESQQMVSLGASLTAQEAQQTLEILGAQNVPQSNITYVDGNTVNQYLNDGSNADTVVYSSAAIEPMDPGYGVQVQILTPENILDVSSTTYQNAAITAGIQNANLRIGTIAPVTGEGALAGVYAMLEEQGVALNPKDVEVAQQEINVIQNIENNTEISNTQINQLIKEIKVVINNNLANSGDREITPEDIESFVRDLAEQNGITDETAINELIDYAKQFAQTDTARDEDLGEQLDQSIQVSWTDTLNSLEGSLSKEEILALNRPDYSDQEIYHPIIQAFSDTFFELVEQDQLVDSLYSHTFVFEAMTPELSNEEKTALNELRALMYQYTAGMETTPGYTKEQWLSNIATIENIKITNPIHAEIIQRVANASGYAPEAFNYNEVQQEGPIVEFFIRWDTETHVSMMDQYTFNVETGEISKLDVATQEYILVEPIFNFEELYGVAVENNYVPTEIPANYVIPGYTDDEATSSDSSESVESSSSNESVSEPDEEETSSVPSEQPSESESVPEENSENTEGAPTETASDQSPEADTTE